MFDCELLKPEVVSYVLSLAFQVAGAVLLIIKYFGKTKERIINEYFPGSNIAKRDSRGNTVLKKEKVQSCVQTIYDNRMAFVFIAVGYILSIFGAINEECKICVLLGVFFFTTIIIIIEKGLSIIISKILYKEDMEITFSEIADRADTIVTNEEIDKLFEE